MIYKQLPQINLFLIPNQILFLSPNNLLDGEFPVCNPVGDEEPLKLNLSTMMTKIYMKYSTIYESAKILHLRIALIATMLKRPSMHLFMYQGRLSSFCDLTMIIKGGNDHQ